MGKRYINCALEYKVVVTIAVIIIIISDKQVLHIYTFWALCNFLGEEDHCPPPPPKSECACTPFLLTCLIPNFPV